MAGQGAAGVRVGVVLPRPSGDPGEWLAEGVAFEAAGADALWLDHGRAPRLDPLILVAALAALTYRTLLVAAVPHGAAEALATVDQLSRGRLALIAGDPGESPPEGGSLSGDALADPGGSLSGDPGGEPLDGVTGDETGMRAIRRLAEGAYEDEGAGRWAPAAVPLGRTAWRELLREHAERGDHGVLVPADPRLLDLLRNPDDPGGREDLQLAQG